MDGYQLSAERGIKGAPDIPMPPLPEEQIPEPVEEQAPIEEPEQEEQQTVQPQQPVYQQENQNIRELREKAYRSEVLERELQEYKRREQEMRKPAPPEEEDYNINLAPDDLAEGKHLSKVNRKVDKEIKGLQEEVRQYKEQMVALSVEAKLKSHYPDFDAVVSSANLETLRRTKPSLFNSMNANPNLYEKAETAYDAIKALNLHQSQDLEQNRIKAQINSSKPKPVASISAQQGQGALSRANAFENGLTEELKAQLIKEMVEARRDR
jgi:hypothetical protein